MPDIPNAIRERIAARVAEGFESRDAVITNTAEVVHDDFGRDDLRPEIERITDELLAAHRQEQRHWPGRTDCDRLDEAFESLEGEGVVARQHFSCCSTCGHVDIWEEINAAREGRAGSASAIRGYVFYHVQNTERACTSGHLYLSFGAVEKGNDKMTAVGGRIARALRAAGLTVEWSGRPDECVQVVGLDWKRRR
jgi:hypothetical protein